MKYGETGARQMLRAWLGAGLLLVAGGLAAQPAGVPRGQPWLARVSYVVDGDSIWVLPEDGGRRAKLRLEGVDAPEICQTAGRPSRDALKAMVLGQSVSVTIKARDRYGRAIATVVRESDGLDVGGAMVAQGWAWNDRYGRRSGKYPKAEARAKAQALGLFAQKRAETPAAFRKRHGACTKDSQADEVPAH